MKAVVCRNAELRVEDLPDPVPGRGQLLVKVLRCGICGSDLHVRRHCNHWGATMVASGYTALTDTNQPVVFGHEFCAEVVDHGPGTRRKLAPGTRIVAPPLLRRGREIDMIGLSTHTTGAYAELMLVEEAMAMPVPNGLSAELAALTEPMAVAWRAVHRGDVSRRDVAVVVGCGPVGLSVIALLKSRGVEKIVASDYSPVRRRLAAACGAHVTVDPGEASPYAHWGPGRYPMDIPDVLKLSVGAMEKLQRLPLPWWWTFRALTRLAGEPRGPVVFECVGAPGVLQGVIDGVPPFSRIVVVGVCMQTDHIEGSSAMNRAVDIRYAAGYSPLEFRDTLHHIAEGRADCSPLLTGTVGLDGVDAAFDALTDAGRHAKILVDPASDRLLP